MRDGKVTAAEAAIRKDTDCDGGDDGGRRRRVFQGAAEVTSDSDGGMWIWFNAGLACVLCCLPFPWSRCPAVEPVQPRCFPYGLIFIGVEQCQSRLAAESLPLLVPRHWYLFGGFTLLFLSTCQTQFYYCSMSFDEKTKHGSGLFWTQRNVKEIQQDLYVCEKHRKNRCSLICDDI